MNLLCHPSALLLLQELPRLPLGKLEYISLVALETAIIWILWKAYRDQVSANMQMMEKQTEFVGKIEGILDRVERFLDSQRHSQDS